MALRWFMKIAIIGFSGAGKSTLAKKLGQKYNLPILHLDSVHFKENWIERPTEEMEYLVQNFIKNNEEWVIDGNYKKIALNRFIDCDLLIYLNYNRFICLFGVIKRYFKYKNMTRSDMAEGCKEKLDFPFLWWVFHKGRTLKRKKFNLHLVKSCKKSIVFKNRKQLNKYLEQLKVEV